MMDKVEKRNIIKDDDIIKILAYRTGIDPKVIETLLHYYERIILHSVMRGDEVILRRLVKIYHDNKQVHIDFSDQAKQYIFKGRHKEKK